MSWKKTTLGELADELGGVVQTGPFGAQLHRSDYQEYGTPTIMPQNIVSDRIDTSEIARVDDSIVRRLSRHVLKEGDIIYPRRGELGKRALITSREAGWLCGTGCLKVSIPEGEIVSKFLFYYFKQSKVTYWLENNAVGSTMLNLSASVLRNFPIEYPDPLIQQAIADTLSAYDDLIDNNNRRIALLEESIHLLYREWFVHLRFPGCDRVEIVDGVPEGWKKVELSELASVNQKSIAKRSAPENIQYVDISSVSTGSINEIQPLRFADAPSRAQRVVQHGDVIWSMVRPGRRSYSLVLHPPENLIASTGFAVLTPEKVPSSFLYSALTMDFFVGHLENVATGAAYPAVKPKDFEAFQILCPSETLLRKFDEYALSVHEQIHNLKMQNQKLREARDRLLPRLMNGSLAV